MKEAGVLLMQGWKGYFGKQQDSQPRPHLPSAGGVCDALSLELKISAARHIFFLFPLDLILYKFSQGAELLLVLHQLPCPSVQSPHLAAGQAHSFLPSLDAWLLLRVS